MSLIINCYFLLLIPDKRNNKDLFWRNIQAKITINISNSASVGTLYLNICSNNGFSGLINNGSGNFLHLLLRNSSGDITYLFYFSFQNDMRALQFVSNAGVLQYFI